MSSLKQIAFSFATMIIGWGNKISADDDARAEATATQTTK
jgi:hypothetical protein